MLFLFQKTLFLAIFLRKSQKKRENQGFVCTVLNFPILLHHIFNNQIFATMEKTKLITVRKSKRIPQEQIAEFLNMSVSCYNRREKGLVYIKQEQWEKLAKILDVSVDDIYESDEPQSFTCKDNASSNHLGTNNGTNYFYTIPEFLLESLQDYITKLKEENEKLKQMLEKK